MKRSALYYKLTKLVNNYKKAQAAANLADDRWDMDPENPELEAAWDKACEIEFAAFDALVDALHECSYGQLTKQAARRMLRIKFDEVEALIRRLA